MLISRCLICNEDCPNLSSYSYSSGRRRGTGCVAPGSEELEPHSQACVGGTRTLKIYEKIRNIREWNICYVR